MYLLPIQCFCWFYMATNQAEETLNYKHFLGLTVTTPEGFLGLCGLKQSGKKVKLVATAFGTYKLAVPTKFTQQQIFDCVKGEYKKKLQTNGIKSDPESLG